MKYKLISVGIDNEYQGSGYKVYQSCLKFMVLNDNINSAELVICGTLRINTERLDFQKEFTLAEIEELYENNNDS